MGGWKFSTAAEGTGLRMPDQSKGRCPQCAAAFVPFAVAKSCRATRVFGKH